MLEMFLALWLVAGIAVVGVGCSVMQKARSEGDAAVGHAIAATGSALLAVWGVVFLLRELGWPTYLMQT